MQQNSTGRLLFHLLMTPCVGLFLYLTILSITNDNITDAKVFFIFTVSWGGAVLAIDRAFFAKGKLEEPLRSTPSNSKQPIDHVSSNAVVLESRWVAESNPIEGFYDKESVEIFKKNMWKGTRSLDDQFIIDVLSGVEGTPWLVARLLELTKEGFASKHMTPEGTQIRFHVKNSDCKVNVQALRNLQSRFMTDSQRALQITKEETVRRHMPPPSHCSRCGESEFTVMTISPKFRSVRWKCNYCDRSTYIRRDITTPRQRPREPIPSAVRAFVWKRDGGSCVICGSQEKLEFDHIIPVAKGGGNTERNIQLLCERCNRVKGTRIGSDT
jgi:5-methylcytosine-specific restriction endonuclease McrA